MAVPAISRLSKKAGRLLMQQYRALDKAARSWRQVSKVIYSRTGIKINAGILNGVAHEKRPPTPQVYKALGLPVPHYRPALACLVCGDVHTRKSCPNKRAARPRPAPKPYRAALRIAALEILKLQLIYPPPADAQIDAKVNQWLEKAAKQ